MAYLRRDGASIPFWRMAALTTDELTQRAEAMAVGEVAEMDAVPGGGTLPSVTIPSVGIVVDGDHAAALRGGHNDGPPIIARVTEGRTHVDLRTVDPTDDQIVAAALKALS